MINGFIDSNIFVKQKKIKKTSLIIESGMIKKINKNIKRNDLIKVPEEFMVVPGFIDEHIHGSNGFDTMNHDIDSVHQIAKSLLQDGVTSFLPTTMTMSKKNISIALNNIEINKNKNYMDCSRILGVNLEGPFISKKYKGAQNEDDILPCDVNTFKEFEKINKNIKIVTLAYEENGSELVSYLKKRHIVASIGHTNCDSTLLEEGINKGITNATHTYNAMKPIHHREIGTVGEVLLNDKVNCELIVDTIHVSPNAIRLLFKCKGKDKIVLITDSMEAKHLVDGQYSLGGQKVIVKDGAARLIDGTLAGSILTLNKGIKNMKDICNLSFEEAINMATINPARNLHMDKLYGSIEEKKCADFAIIDKDFNVLATIVGGNILYKKEDYSWLK